MSSSADRFEELPDDPEDTFAELDAVLEEVADAPKPAAQCFFSMYMSVRKVFSENTSLLDDFGQKEEYEDKIRFLLELQEVKTTLENLKSERNNPDTEVENDVSQVSQWKEAPSLAYGQNKNYPHLSKALEVKNSKTEGRYLSSTMKINAGDVLIVDRPYTTSLFNPFYSTHCLNCFRRLQKTFMECPACKRVRFCDKNCFQECYSKTHRWECAVLDLIDNDDIGRMATIAYRIVSKTGFKYLQSMSGKLDSTPATYSEGDYISVYKQVDNKEKRPVGDHLKRCFTALFLTRCLQLTNWFPEEFRTDFCSTEFVYIAALMTKHIQACACNAYEINEFVKKGASMVNSESLELGGAVYPTISLSNHSCAANTSRTNYGTYCCVRATRTIFPNEKVYDNYGLFYHTESSDDRKQRLNLQYFFDCNCVACKNDWPLYRDFARAASVYHCPGCKYSLGTSIERLKKCSKCKKDLKGLGKLVNHLKKINIDYRKIMDEITEETAPKYIKTYSVLLAEIEKIFLPPCREITELQQILLQSSAVLGNHSVVRPTPEESQVVLFNQDGVSSDDEESDEDDIPGLI